MELVINSQFLDIANKDVKMCLDTFLQSNKNLYIQSPMGSGKSNIIKEILKQDKRVLLITNRVSLSYEFKNRFKEYNIKHYKDTTHAKKLIVQYDSLHKIDINEFDIFILDEFMSLLPHSQNNLSNKNLFNLAKLFIITNTRKIVVLDAFLNNIDVKNSIRIINEYRVSKSVTEYKDKNALLEKMFNTQESITISCNSLMFAKALYLKFKELKRKVFLLSSETPDNVKDVILKELKTKRLFDVFIFTPTITTGVDILHYKNHFHIDEGGSCDLISSLQMIGRNRHAENIFYYIKHKLEFKETSPDRLNEKLSKEIQAHKISNPALVEMDYKSGNYKISLLAEFYNKILALRNKQNNNKRNSFHKMLLQQYSHIEINSKKVKENILKETLLKVKECKNNEIYEACITEINDINIQNNQKREFKLRQKIEFELDILKCVVNTEYTKDMIKDFLLDRNFFNAFRIKEYYKMSLNDLMRVKRNNIENLNFENVEIDCIIKNKQDGFEIKDFYTKKTLKKHNIALLKLLGYKLIRNKFIKSFI